MTRLLRARTPLALLLALAFVVSGCTGLRSADDYTVRAELSRSFNLFPGSPVKVLGVQVGQITDIEVPDGAEHVEVVMRLAGDVEVPADTSAIVVPASLLGERYVQLAAHSEGELLADGATIPLERTEVPFEFDEVMRGLEDFVSGLDGPEVGRFVANLAETLEGQGDQLGRTIDSAGEAIGVLRDNDEELVELASQLADLNATLGSRDAELAQLLQDFDLVAASLVDDRTDIDQALSGLVRVTDELGQLLATNRVRLEDDIEVLTRVGRTAQRNLDNVSTAILSSAELFRHAERIIDRERGFLPLQDQLFALAPVITEGVVFRISGLCLQAGLPEDLCALDAIEGLLGGLICTPPLFPCPGDGSATPFEEALLNLTLAEPELGEVVLEQMAREDDPPDPDGDEPDLEELPDDEVEDDGEERPGVLDGLGGLLGGGR